MILVIRRELWNVRSLGHRVIEFFEIFALGNRGLCISVRLCTFERAYLKEIDKSIPFRLSKSTLSKDICQLILSRPVS